MAKVDGLDRLKARFAKIPPHVRSAMRQAMADGADEVTAMQKRLVPKRTGALADSIVQTWGGDVGPAYASLRSGGGGRAAGDLSVKVTAGNTRVRYAHLVEFGTAPHIAGGMFKGAQHPGTRAQPFFYSAWRALKRRVKSQITRASKKAIQRGA